MRRVFFVGLLFVLATSAFAADGEVESQARIKPPIGVVDAPPPTEDPQARIMPPGGLAAESRASRPRQGTIQPPARLERNRVDVFWRWLLSHARVMPPIG